MTRSGNHTDSTRLLDKELRNKLTEYVDILVDEFNLQVPKQEKQHPKDKYAEKQLRPQTQSSLYTSFNKSRKKQEVNSAAAKSNNEKEDAP
jgi:DNA primase catalytic subunit